MTVQLDTDIAIEVLRGRNQAILAQWSSLTRSAAVVLYSPIVAAEIWAGTLPHEHSFISRFFLPLICVAADYEIGEKTGDLLRLYARSHGLELPDAMIAATAIQYEASLWTRNRKHYPMPQLTFY